MFTEFALTTDGLSDGRAGAPTMVLRLDLRRSQASWEDLDRKRLRRLWGTEVLRNEFLLLEFKSSSWSSSADSCGVAVAEYGIDIRPGPGSSECFGEEVEGPLLGFNSPAAAWLVFRGLDSFCEGRPGGSFEGAFPMVGSGSPRSRTD